MQSEYSVMPFKNSDLASGFPVLDMWKIRPKNFSCGAGALARHFAILRTPCHSRHFATPTFLRPITGFFSQLARCTIFWELTACSRAR